MECTVPPGEHSNFSPVVFLLHGVFLCAGSPRPYLGLLFRSSAPLAVPAELLLVCTVPFGVLSKFSPEVSVARHLPARRPPLRPFRRHERAGLAFSLQWCGREVMLGNLHNPDSKNRKWKSTKLISQKHEEVMGTRSLHC